MGLPLKGMLFLYEDYQGDIRFVILCYRIGRNVIKLDIPFPFHCHHSSASQHCLYIYILY